MLKVPPYVLTLTWCTAFLVSHIGATSSDGDAFEAGANANVGTTDYSYAEMATNSDAKNSQAADYLAKHFHKRRRWATRIATPAPAPTPVPVAVPAPAFAGTDLLSYNLVSDDRKDICKLCECKLDANQPIVNCSFSSYPGNIVLLNDVWKVPGDVLKISIYAGSKDIRLENGFFTNNRVNSFTVNGSGREQIEVASSAFNGNKAPYPDVHFNNLNSVVLKRKIMTGSFKLTVIDTNDVIVYPNAFEGARLASSFKNIKDLRMEENAFYSSTAVLLIESSHMDHLYRFGGSLHVIHITKSTINTIQTGAFDMQNINSTIIEKSDVHTIKSKTFTEKLRSQQLSIDTCRIKVIEEEAIYGSGIERLDIINNDIDTMQGRAIAVTAINITVVRNHIKHLNKDAIQLKDWSNVIVNSNQFGVFEGILIGNTTQPKLCRFENNSISDPKSGSLNITNSHCVLREVIIQRKCSCTLNWLAPLTDRDLRSEIYCTVENLLKDCFNTSIIHAAKYFNEVCDEQKTELNCSANKNLKRVEGTFYTPEELAETNRNWSTRIYMFIAIICATLLMILLLLSYFLWKKRRNTQNKQVANPHLHVFSPWDRETIDKTLFLAKDKYPQIYKVIKPRIEQMYSNDISNNRCLTLIAEIVEEVDKVKNTGDDFLALQRVLEHHLQPPSASAPLEIRDPVYTEPSMMGTIDGSAFTTSSTFVALPTELYDVNQTNLTEHIYAEPNCAQQPLLRNEYASPADRNMDSMDLYTEPINERDPNPVSSAYAVSQPQQPMQRLPKYTTPQRNIKHPAGLELSLLQQRNLPDVLYRSKIPKEELPGPSTSSTVNVRKIAQDLQNMPKFHLKPFTPTNAYSPIYTAPSIKRKQDEARLATPEIDDCALDMRGAAALPTDSGSNHSGGSNETVKIDDVILYADA